MRKTRGACDGGEAREGKHSVYGQFVRQPRCSKANGLHNVEARGGRTGTFDERAAGGAWDRGELRLIEWTGDADDVRGAWEEHGGGAEVVWAVFEVARSGA